MSKSRYGWALTFSVLISMNCIAQNSSVNKKTKEKMEMQQDVKMTAVVNPDNVSLIDKIVIPKKSVEEMLKQTSSLNLFIKKLPGLISQQAFQHTDDEGNMTLITVATWKDQHALNNAREAVQGEFQRLNLNPQEFFSRLAIKMERSVYHPINH